MIAADLGRAALIASVPAAYWLGALTIEQLYAVGFVVGFLSVLFNVSYGTLFVALVPRERYVDANSLTHGARALSFVVGPSIGGVLVQLLRAPAALVVDACSFLVSRRSRSRESRPRSRRSSLRSAVISSPGCATSPARRSSALPSGATATINFFNFVFFALFILYANRYLDVGPGLLGVVLGIGAIGSVIGAAVSGRIVRRIGIGPAFVVGCVLFPVPLVLVPLAGGPRWLVLACLALAEFGSGFGVMILDIAAGTLSMAVVPDRLRARVSGAYMVVNYGVRPLGAFLGGALGTAIGVRPTLWIATVGAIAGFAWLLPSPVMSLRDLPEQDEFAATAG